MAKPLSNAQRALISEKLMELGNIAIGALFFGQAFSGFPFDARVALLGVVMVISLYIFALVVGGSE